MIHMTNNNNDPQELKPCPFCGQGPEVIHEPYDQYKDRSGQYSIICRKCGINFCADTVTWDYKISRRVDMTVETIAKISARWNKRI